MFNIYYPNFSEWDDSWFVEKKRKIKKFWFCFSRGLKWNVWSKIKQKNYISIIVVGSHLWVIIRIFNKLILNKRI